MELQRFVNNFAIKAWNSFQNVDSPYLNHPELQKSFLPELVVKVKVTSRVSRFKSINLYKSVFILGFSENLLRPSQLKSRQLVT